MKPLRKRNREQLPIMLDFAEQIESELDSKEFERDDLFPAIYEARNHAGRLKAWLAEINWLVLGE